MTSRRDGVAAGWCSRRRDCHFADIPSPSLLKRLPKGEGMPALMKVSPTARLMARHVDRSAPSASFPSAAAVRALPAAPAELVAASRPDILRMWSTLILSVPAAPSADTAWLTSIGEHLCTREPSWSKVDTQSRVASPACLAVRETVILLHAPLPLAGVSTEMKRGCQQNDSLADG